MRRAARIVVSARDRRRLEPAADAVARRQAVARHTLNRPCPV